MNRRYWLPCSVGALLALKGAGGKSEGALVVIVNRSNRLDSLSRSQLRYLFLRNVSRWPWGQEAEPIDLPAHDVTRQEFTREVLLTTEAQLGTYWIGQRATYGLRPPAMVRDAATAKDHGQTMNINVVRGPAPGQFRATRFLPEADFLVQAAAGQRSLELVL
jgi:hypothetical protein